MVAVVEQIGEVLNVRCTCGIIELGEVCQSRDGACFICGKACVVPVPGGAVTVGADWYFFASAEVVWGVLNDRFLLISVGGRVQVHFQFQGLGLDGEQGCDGV